MNVCSSQPWPVPACPAWLPSQSQLELHGAEHRVERLLPHLRCRDIHTCVQSEPGLQAGKADQAVRVPILSRLPSEASNGTSSPVWSHQNIMHICVTTKKLGAQTMFFYKTCIGGNKPQHKNVGLTFESNSALVESSEDCLSKWNSPMTSKGVHAMN